MVEDAISVCVKNGYSPDWLIELDCANFAAIYASVKRVEARDRMWEVNAISVASNPTKDGKPIKKLMKTLRTWLPWAEIKQSMGTAQDFRNIMNKNGR